MGQRVRSVDIEEMFDVMEGDVWFIKDCFGDFIMVYRRLLEDVRLALESSDIQALEKTASDFKKILDVVSAHHAAYLALDLELMGRNDDVVRARETFTALSLECGHVRDLMEEFIETCSLHESPLWEYNAG